MSQLHVYVPKSLAEEVRRRAEAVGLSVSRYLGQLLRREVGEGWPEGWFDERLLLQAHHNVALWLVEAVDPLEALARYERVRRLYEPFATDASMRLWRRWLKARIHAGLGDADQPPRRQRHSARVQRWLGTLLE